MDEGRRAIDGAGARPAVSAGRRRACHRSHLGPEGMNALVGSHALRDTPGQYQADWTAEKPGTYLAEVTAESAASQPQELGRDVVTFQREDGVAENFHTEQNRHLLEQLASETGGQLLEALRSEESAARYLLLRSRHLRSQHEGALGYADRVPAPAGPANRRVAAAPQMGCGMKRALLLAIGLCSRAPGARRHLLRHRGRPRRRARLRAALHRRRKRSRPHLQGGRPHGPRLHA